MQTNQCPKSVITSQSKSYIELFWHWKQFGLDGLAIESKSAEAILLLEQEWQKEKKHVEAERIGL